jgi:MSHA biogenesis protein MshQ
VLSIRPAQIFLRIAALACLLSHAGAAMAVNYFSNGSGDWTANKAWKLTSCAAGGDAGNAQPGDSAADTATICSGDTVRLDSTTTITTLTILGTGRLNMSDAVARTLTVSGNVSVAASGGIIRFGDGFNQALIVQGTLGNSGTIDADNTQAGTKTLTVTGLITNSATGVIRFAGATNVMTINANGGISNAGTFDVNTATVVNHVLNVGAGNIANTGTFDLAPSTTALAQANFTDTAADQTISGTGATTRFWRISMTKSTKARVLEVTANNFSFRQSGTQGAAGNGSLTINSGTFRLSAAVTIDPFSDVPDADPTFPGTQLLTATAGYVLGANCGFHLNNAGATVNVSNGAGIGNYNLTLSGGTLQIDGGTMVVGDAADTRIRLANSAATIFSMSAGSLTVAGRLTVVARTDVSNFTLSGGTILLNTAGNADNLGFGAFVLGSGVGSTFTMSGGTIVIQQADASALIGNEYDIETPAAGVSVTGGTVQLGNAATAAASTFQIRSDNAAIWNLVVDATTNTKTALLVNSALTISNALTIGTGSTLNANSLNIFMGSTASATPTGTWTNNGIFTPGTQTVTFQGANASQSIGGSASTSFSGLTVDKSLNTLAVTVNTVVNATLTLTKGKVIPSGANRIIVGTAGTSTGSSSASYVVGCVRKNYAAGTPGAFTFAIGDATNYTPVTQTFTSATVVGDVTACVTATDHPQVTTTIPSSGIDKVHSVNRYWTLTANQGTTGTPNGTYSLTFGYISADNDDAVTDPPTYIVQHYNGSVWASVTVTPTPSATAATATGIALYGDFAIGGPIASSSTTIGRFNAFETSVLAGSTTGSIFTKIADGAITLRVVALNAAKTAVDTTFKGDVTVTIYNSSDNSGSANTAACKPNWTALVGVPTYNVTMVAGVGTLSIANAPANVFQDLRLRMVDVNSGALIGCSTDRFALRPKELLVEALDGDWQSSGTTRTLHNTAATGGNVHAASTASKPFTLRVTARNNGGATTTNYAGTPTVVAGYPACVQPTGVCTVGTFNRDALSFTSGVGTANAYYSEVGSFNIAFEDATFAAVDVGDGTPALTYTIPQASPSPREIGRFVPDHFDLASNNTPQFQTFGASCAGGRSFTYVGQAFGYATAPIALVTAKNAAGTTTVNYQGALWKLSGTSPLSRAWSNNGTGPALDNSLAANAATVAAITTPAPVGTGTITLSSADKLSYTRSTATPIAPYTANISLALGVSDSSEAGPAGNPLLIPTTTTALFNGGGTGIAFDAGAAFRYGRVLLVGAVGSERVDLSNIALRAQYYTGTTFVTNTQDHCTAFASNNFGFTAYTGTLSANLPAGNIQGAVTLASGVASIKVTKPGSSATGTAVMCLDLDVTGTGDTTCSAVAGGDKSWLQGPWGSATYDKDPSARIGFGYFGAQPRNFIFFRENY